MFTLVKDGQQLEIDELVVGKLRMKGSRGR